MRKVLRLLVILALLNAPIAVQAQQACFNIFEAAGESEIIDYADAFQSYIALRIATMNEADQLEVQSILSRIRFQTNFKTAAYDQLGRSIVIDSNITKDMLAHFDLLAHEIEHSIQVLGKNRVGLILGHVARMLMPTAAISRHIVRTEHEAIGAEWDFLNSLPKVARDRGIQELRSKNLNPKLMFLLEEALAKADLPRDQYIRECAKSAKYTMGYQLIYESGLKIAAYSLLALTGYQWWTDNEE
jgi:hypothetical protein